MTTTRSLLEAPDDVAREVRTWLRARVPELVAENPRPGAPEELALEVLRSPLFAAATSFEHAPFAEVNAPLRRWMERVLPDGETGRAWQGVVEAAGDLLVLRHRIARAAGAAFEAGWRVAHVETLAEALLARVNAAATREPEHVSAALARAALLFALCRYPDADAAYAALERHDEAYVWFQRGVLARVQQGVLASESFLHRALEALGDDRTRVFPALSRESRWEEALIGRRFRDLVLVELATCALHREDGARAVELAEQALECTDHPIRALQMLSRGLHFLAQGERDHVRARRIQERNLDALERSWGIEPRKDEALGALALARTLGDEEAVARWQARAAEDVAPKALVAVHV